MITNESFSRSYFAAAFFLDRQALRSTRRSSNHSAQSCARPCVYRIFIFHLPQNQPPLAFQCRMRRAQRIGGHTGVNIMGTWIRGKSRMLCTEVVVRSGKRYPLQRLRGAVACGQALLQPLLGWLSQDVDLEASTMYTPTGQEIERVSREVHRDRRSQGCARRSAHSCLRMRLANPRRAAMEALKLE